MPKLYAWSSLARFEIRETDVKHKKISYKSENAFIVNCYPF